MTESGKPLAFWIALRRGVTLSALLAMNKMGVLVLPANGPIEYISTGIPYLLD